MTSNSAAKGVWRQDLALIALAALAAFLFCLLSSIIFADGDTNTHVATGQWILAHRAVPTVDPFSYTFAGQPWVAHEWLSDLFMAVAYDAAGWSGVRVLTCVAVAAVFALMAIELRRSLRLLSVIAALGLSFTVLLGHLLARPHVLSLPILVIWTMAMLDARRRGRVPTPWLAPLMTLWANMHGTFVVGLGLSAVFALEDVLAAKGRRFGVAVRWGVFGTVCTAFALITPHGLQYLLYPFSVLSMSELQSIGEWQAINFQHWYTLVLALFFALFVLLYWGVKIPALRLGVVLLLLYMTLQHIRQEIVLATVGTLLLAEPLGRTLNTAAPVQPVAWPPPRALVWPLAAIAAVFVALGGTSLAMAERRPDSTSAPMTALAHVPASVRATPVFNDYSSGGWLLFNNVRPFIDGRGDMYGDAFIKTYLDTARADPATLDRVFRRYGVAWTILPPSSPLVARLDTTPGWRRLYADKWAVVQVRAAPGAQP